jgi:hypothetical protein
MARQTTVAMDLVQIREDILCALAELAIERWPGSIQAARLSEHGFVLDLSIDPDTNIDLKSFKQLTTKCLKTQRHWDRDRWAFHLTQRRTSNRTLRIQGLAFGSKVALKRFRTRRQVIRQSNPKRLGRQHELFTVPDSLGGSDLLWLPAGTAIREEITRSIAHLITNAGFRPIRGGLDPLRVANYLRSATHPQAFETHASLVREHYKGRERASTRTSTVLWSLSSPADLKNHRRGIESLAERIAQSLGLLDFKVVDRCGRDGLPRWVYLAQNRVRRSIALGDLVTHPLEDFSAKETLVEAHLPRAHEELFYFLLEHFGGAWPTWLAPTQVVVLPVAPKWETYAQFVTQRLREADIRVRLHAGQERLAKRVRTEILNKTPHLITVGATEEESNSVTWRRHEEGAMRTLPLNAVTGEIGMLVAAGY